MKHTCPYCGEPLRKELVIPPMTEQMRIIYEAVSDAGPKGIMARNLIEIMCSDGIKRADGTLRTRIHYINERLVNFNKIIKSEKKSGYRLYSIKEE